MISIHGIVFGTVVSLLLGKVLNDSGIVSSRMGLSPFFWVANAVLLVLPSGCCYLLPLVILSSLSSVLQAFGSFGASCEGAPIETELGPFSRAIDICMFLHAEFLGMLAVRQSCGQAWNAITLRTLNLEHYS